MFNIMISSSVKQYTHTFIFANILSDEIINLYFYVYTSFNLWVTFLYIIIFIVMFEPQCIDIWWVQRDYNKNSVMSSFIFLCQDISYFKTCILNATYQKLLIYC